MRQPFSDNHERTKRALTSCAARLRPARAYSSRQIVVISAQNQSAASDLVARFGWNSTAYQILNPGIEHWFSPGGEAVVGYVRQPRRWIVAGAPVCDESKVRDVAEQFEREAAAAGVRRVLRLRDGSASRRYAAER